MKILALKVGDYSGSDNLNQRLSWFLLYRPHIHHSLWHTPGSLPDLENQEMEETQILDPNEYRIASKL